MRNTALMNYCAAVLLCLAVSPVLAANKANKLEAGDEIARAKRLLRQIESSVELRDYIPFKNYYDAKVYLDTAIYQYDEREYDESALYSVFACVEFETTLAIAQARLTHANKLKAIKDFFLVQAQKAAWKNKQRVTMMDLGFINEGNGYVTLLFDYAIFKDRGLEITKAGSDRLDIIYNFLKQNSWSRFKIIGHTRADDPKNALSQKKAEKVAEYLKNKGGIGARRFEIRGEGNKYPATINGTKYLIDRVEIRISGI